MNSVNRLLLILASSVSFAALADQGFSADKAFGAEMPAALAALSLKQAIAEKATDTRKK